MNYSGPRWKRRDYANAAINENSTFTNGSYYTNMDVKNRFGMDAAVALESGSEVTRRAFELTVQAHDDGVIIGVMDYENSDVEKGIRMANDILPDLPGVYDEGTALPFPLMVPEFAPVYKGKSINEGAGDEECNGCGYYGPGVSNGLCDECDRPDATASAHEIEAHDRYRRVHRRDMNESVDKNEWYYENHPVVGEAAWHALWSWEETGLSDEVRNFITEFNRSSSNAHILQFENPDDDSGVNPGIGILTDTKLLYKTDCEVTKEELEHAIRRIGRDRPDMTASPIRVTGGVTGGMMNESDDKFNVMRPPPSRDARIENAKKEGRDGFIQGKSRDETIRHSRTSIGGYSTIARYVGTGWDDAKTNSSKPGYPKFGSEEMMESADGYRPRPKKSKKVMEAHDPKAGQRVLTREIMMNIFIEMQDIMHSNGDNPMGSEGAFNYKSGRLKELRERVLKNYF